MTPTLFQALLGASFYSLAPAVRALHDVRGRVRYAGRATIARGRNPLGRLCAAVAGLPKAREDVPVTVDFDARPDGEAWLRNFGGQRSEEHTSVQSLMRISYAVFCLNKKIKNK